MGLVAWLLWQWRDRFRPGVLFALYLVLSGLERFLVEFVRRNEDTVAGLTTPQVESLVLMAVGSDVDRGRQPPAGRYRGPGSVSWCDRKYRAATPMPLLASNGRRHTDLPA